MNNSNFFYSLDPAIRGSGFSMDGYYVWCGSVIKEEDIYYLFAARWKKEKTFPSGYLTDSEIVLATTNDLSHPFKYLKTIITKRSGKYWDSVMSHNPYIVKGEDGYYLYYIGSPDGGYENRKIGVAYSKSLLGDWQRPNKPIDLPPNANNPCVLKTRSGKVLLYFRDGSLKVHIAESNRFDGEFRVIAEDILPKGKVEDMFVYEANEGFVMLAEDATGAYTGLTKGGLRAYSDDGIKWHEENITAAYGFEVEYDDGERQILQRRERPFILFDGENKYLFNGAKVDGETTLTGGDTWNMLQKIIKEKA